jgi:hypothetical protein
MVDFADFDFHIYFVPLSLPKAPRWGNILIISFSKVTSIFSHLSFDQMAPHRRFSELTFRPSGATNH